jgi:hypothetical protein
MAQGKKASKYYHYEGRHQRHAQADFVTFMELVVIVMEIANLQHWIGVIFGRFRQSCSISYSLGHIGEIFWCIDVWF